MQYICIIYTWHYTRPVICSTVNFVYWTFCYAMPITYVIIIVVLLFNSQRNELNLASQHATTNYYLNPHDHNARANYEYYLNRDDTCNPGNECKSLETKLYRDLYVNGTKLYNEKEFKQMVKSFELSLKYFFMELKKCRYIALCA